MNRPAALLSFLVVSSLANAAERVVRCATHSHLMRITEVGSDHVAHRAVLNGVTEIREVTESNWFVESTGCTRTGFMLRLSHRQYGDATERKLRVSVLSRSRYRIKSADNMSVHRTAYGGR